jgi:hypothetical protein
LSGTVFALVTGYAFDGFQQPVDNVGINVAKAGRAIPLKWRVLDLGGNPVTNLAASAVTVNSVKVECGTLDGILDAIEEYASATGSSGLQTLGNGYYQLNWATESGWAGTCRRLQVALGQRQADGTPIFAYNTAAFSFSR